MSLLMFYYFTLQDLKGRQKFVEAESCKKDLGEIIVVSFLRV